MRADVLVKFARVDGFFCVFLAGHGVIKNVACAAFHAGVAAGPDDDGRSAGQFIPAIAGEVGHLTVFQRTPGWFIPSPNYTEAIGPAVRWLRREVPGYTHWSRFWTFWRNVEGMMPLATVDPEWDGGERSVSEANDLMRQMLTGYLESQFAEQKSGIKVVAIKLTTGREDSDGNWKVEGAAALLNIGGRQVDGDPAERQVISRVSECRGHSLAAFLHSA